MAEIKGVLLSAWLNFLKDRYGPSRVSDALESLDQEDRAALAKPFLASSWYTYDTLHALRRLTRKLWTPDEGDISPTIGRRMAQDAFTGVYQSLLEKDPIKQVEKFSWIGDFFFREARTLETEITGDASCLVRYRYEKGANPTQAICESLKHFWSRTLELSGASNVASAHPKCAARGQNICEFSFHWSTGS